MATFLISSTMFGGRSIAAVTLDVTSSPGNGSNGSRLSFAIISLNFGVWTAFKSAWLSVWATSLGRFGGAKIARDNSDSPAM